MKRINLASSSGLFALAAALSLSACPASAQQGHWSLTWKIDGTNHYQVTSSDPNDSEDFTDPWAGQAVQVPTYNWAGNRSVKAISKGHVSLKAT